MYALSKLLWFINESETSYFKWIWNNTDISKYDSLLDFGCGNPSSSAEFFRKKGLDVYAYDLKGDHSNGWLKISNKKLEDPVDVSLCSFVLSTMSEEEEIETIDYLKEISQHKIYCLIGKPEKTLDKKVSMTNNSQKKFDTNIEINKEKEAIQTNKGIIRTPLLNQYGFKKLSNFPNSTLWVFNS